jgi:hypothetical protein
MPLQDYSPTSTAACDYNSFIDELIAKGIV